MPSGKRLPVSSWTGEYQYTSSCLRLPICQALTSPFCCTALRLCLLCHSACQVSCHQVYLTLRSQEGYGVAARGLLPNGRLQSEDLWRGSRQQCPRPTVQPTRVSSLIIWPSAAVSKVERREIRISWKCVLHVISLRSTELRGRTAYSCNFRSNMFKYFHEATCRLPV